MSAAWLLCPATAGNGHPEGSAGQSGGRGMAQRESVCRQCELLEGFLAGRTREVPCIICDRLWSEATLKRFERGETLPLSGWAVMNAVPHAPATAAR